MKTEMPKFKIGQIVMVKDLGQAHNPSEKAIHIGPIVSIVVRKGEYLGRRMIKGVVQEADKCKSPVYTVQGHSLCDLAEEALFEYTQENLNLLWSDQDTTPNSYFRESPTK